MKPVNYAGFVNAANGALMDNILNGASFQIKGEKADSENPQQVTGVKSADYARTLSKTNKVDQNGNPAELSGLIRKITGENPAIALISDEAVAQLVNLLAAETLESEPEKPNELRQKLKDELQGAEVEVAGLRAEIAKAKSEDGPLSLINVGRLTIKLGLKEKFVEERKAILGMTEGDSLKELTDAIGNLADKIGEATNTVMKTVSEVIADSIQEAFGLTDDEMDVVCGRQEADLEADKANGMDKKEPWQRTLKDLSGGGAMSPKTGLGLFMLKSLDEGIRLVRHAREEKFDHTGLFLFGKLRRVTVVEHRKLVVRLAVVRVLRGLQESSLTAGAAGFQGGREGTRARDRRDSQNGCFGRFRRPHDVRVSSPSARCR